MDFFRTCRGCVQSSASTHEDSGGHRARTRIKSGPRPRNDRRGLRFSLAKSPSIFPNVFDEFFIEFFAEGDDVFEVVSPEDDGAVVAL